MPDIAGIYALGATLGAAGIGAFGGGLLQRAKRKQEVSAATLEWQRAAREAERLSASLALEAAATARVSVQAWLSSVERVMQDIAFEVPVDAQQFDDAFQHLHSELAAAVYRLEAVSAPVGGAVTPESGQPYIERAMDFLILVRSDLLRVRAGMAAVHEPMQLRDTAVAIGVSLGRYLDRRADALADAARHRHDDAHDLRQRVQQLALDTEHFMSLSRDPQRALDAYADGILREKLEKTAAAHDEVETRLVAVHQRIAARGDVPREGKLITLEQLYKQWDHWKQTRSARADQAEELLRGRSLEHMELAESTILRELLGSATLPDAPSAEAPVALPNEESGSDG